MKNTYVLFMEKNTQHRINLDSILYVRTNRRYTTMYAGKKLYHFDATLEELMADPSLDCLVQILDYSALRHHPLPAEGHQPKQISNHRVSAVEEHGKCLEFA